MKKAILAIYLSTLASMVWASCTTHTITQSNGRMVTCTTCCYGASCSTNCF